MNLSDYVTSFRINTRPDESWVVLGPEAELFSPGLHPAATSTQLEPESDGLLLTGVLSATDEAVTWLQRVVETINEGTILIVIDWQSDGPLNDGPELKQRFKRGKLCRLLRESGFGVVETLDNHPVYYIVRAVKGPPPCTPHAGKYVPVAKLAELPINTMKTINLFGHNIIVANTGKEIVAVGRACPHANTPLDRGLLKGRYIVCPLHAYIWNVHTGEPVQPADEDTLPLYPVKVDPVRELVLVALAPGSEKRWGSSSRSSDTSTCRPISA